MISTTDEEMADPAQHQQERGDEVASVSVASLSTQQIGDVDVSTSDRTAAADAGAATATARTLAWSRTSRRIKVLAFCGIAALLALAMGVAVATMGDTGPDEGAYHGVGVSAAERQPMNAAPSAGSPVEDTAVAGLPELIADPVVAVASDVSEAPTATPTATPSATPSAMPTATPTAALTSAPNTVAPTAAPTEALDDDFWGFGRSSGDSAENEGGFGQDDFWESGPADSSGGGDDFLGLNLLESSSSGDGDGADDFFGFNLFESSSSSGDAPDDADEDGCFDDVVCCFTFGLLC